MTRKQIGAVLGAVVLAVAAPFLTLAVLHVLDGTAQAQPPFLTLDMPVGQADAEFSWGLALGDIDDDGYADVVVGAGFEHVDGNEAQGRAYVFSGPGGSYLRTLNTPNPKPGVYFGNKVAVVGDLNDDGKGDIAVGAEGEDVGSNEGQGRAYVFSGANGSLLYTLNTPNPQTGAFFGSRVAGGDVNGDGYADIAVGAPGDDVGGKTDQGRAYVFSGFNGSLLYTLNTPNPQAGAGFGLRLTAGDVTGDGKADIVVGAFEEDVGGNTDQGRAYVFNGPNGSYLRTLDSPNPQPGAWFGASEAVGDVNADGKGDIAVSAHWEDVDGKINQGRAYVFSGADGSLLHTLDSPNPQEVADFGGPLAMGDVDADGKADIAVAAHLEDVSGTEDQGRAYVFSGADGSLLGTLDTPNPQEDPRFGWSVAVGDVTGDGYADVAVGADMEDVDGREDQGRAYVFASPAEPATISIGFDMNITGNACPNNGNDCALDSIEKCEWRPTGGGPVEFDVVLDGLPSGESIKGWSADIGEKNGQTVGPITAYTHNNVNVNLPAQPGSGLFMDFSDATGTTVPTFHAIVLDLGAAEHNPPYTRGTLGRYVINTTGISEGVYQLTLDNVVLDRDIPPGGDLCDTRTCDILDGRRAYGLIAVGVPCPDEVDLEKDDLYVKPFYCGDTDMDGDEATGDRVPAGTGTCCDGVDNEGDTQTDGQDDGCRPHINEDPLDDIDNDDDGYEGEDRPGVGCPWNGDDDCDGAFDEDPKNGLDDDGDGLVDEDPANGFLGIDNDRDYAIDEDGAGRFDLNGDTTVDVVQFEGVDDDGDTSVDEDPLDSPTAIEEMGVPAHEPHYLIKELLLNNGPTTPVTALDTTELDAPAWRADLKEDGFTTCTDNLNNDGDAADGCDVDGCPGIPDPDPQCLNEHIGEEAPGLHACNDGKDNGDGWGVGDNLIDELDPDDCGTATEVSVECENPTDIISVKEGVHWYIKPPSNDPILLTIPGCAQYFDPGHSKCVPCKIPKGVGPIEMPCTMVMQPAPWQPGYCVAADSLPGVQKELDLKRLVQVPMLIFYWMTNTVPEWPSNPVGTTWNFLTDDWYVWQWEDRDGSEDLTVGDQLWMENLTTFQAKWFRVYATDPGIFSMNLGEKTQEEHQYDLACLADPSLHKFTIQNELAVVPGQDLIDPNPDNNALETEMLVACTAYTHGYPIDLSDLGPRNVDVTYADTRPAIVLVRNSESSVQDFIVTMEAQSPGLGIGGPEGLKDTDHDDWADNVEGLLQSDPGNPLKTPESIHVAGSCSDGDDNDLAWGKDAADLKCVDTDGDGYSDGEEYMFGSNPLDPSKTPEHMQLPWTCDDDVDNDGDGGTPWGSCDNNGCPAYLADVEGDGPDTDTWADCSIDQLTAIRPPVMCAAGWMATPGATYDIKIANNGDLSVAINIPVLGLGPGEVRPVAGESIFNCFQPGLYPEQHILASIRPANPHVVDLGPTGPLETSFTGTATCTGGNADLVVQDWMFGPAPSYILPINEWEEWDTANQIHNDGPNVAEQVRVRKDMYVPAGPCMGYVSVGYDEETIAIAAGAYYKINDGPLWNPGPAELVEDDVNLFVGDKVYVWDMDGVVPLTTPELSAWFLLPDPIPVEGTTFAHEGMGIMCQDTGDYPFFFSNQVTLANYPAMCDPTLGNISMDLMVEAHARDCSVTDDTDSDTFKDNVECYVETDPWDNCPDKTGSAGKCPGVDCDGDDAWPLDINIDKFVTMADVNKYAGRLGSTGGPPPSPAWLKRLDFNKDNFITMADVNKYAGKLGKKCT